MAVKDFKTCVFEQLAKTGKAFSNANRIELLEMLAQGDRTVETLANLVNMSVANTSQHLQVLRNAGLVSSIKKGQYVEYAITSEAVVDILIKLRELAKVQLESIEKMLITYQPEHANQKVVLAEDLARMAEDVLVIDVRPADEYQAGHIDGAVNIPFDELDRRMQELPTDKPMVAYCRGPYCLMSRQAVHKLTEHGITAKRLQEGYTEWQYARHSAL
jgi:rhodanese-related sulfurtransferase/DNA-binding transcriptional ArsR family regulator